MPNCSFYATLEDHAQILAWLFAEPTCRVYESYSALDEPLQRFTSVDQVLAQFERRLPNGQPATDVALSLYVPDSGPPFTSELITLQPKYAAATGCTHRFAARGWGLIGLHLCVPSKSELRNSNTNHNSQKRAEAWESVAAEVAPAHTWDFAKITAFSSRLNRTIRKRAVGKLGSYAVLPCAAELWRENFMFLPKIWDGAQLMPVGA